MNRYQVTARTAPLACDNGCIVEVSDVRDAVRQVQARFPKCKIITRVDEFRSDGKQRFVPSSEYKASVTLKRSI